MRRVERQQPHASCMSPLGAIQRMDHIYRELAHVLNASSSQGSAVVGMTTSGLHYTWLQ